MSLVELCRPSICRDLIKRLAQLHKWALCFVQSRLSKPTSSTGHRLKQAGIAVICSCFRRSTASGCWARSWFKVGFVFSRSSGKQDGRITARWTAWPRDILSGWSCGDWSVGDCSQQLDQKGCWCGFRGGHRFGLDISRAKVAIFQLNWGLKDTPTGFEADCEAAGGGQKGFLLFENADNAELFVSKRFAPQSDVHIEIDRLD